MKQGQNIRIGERNFACSPCESVIHIFAHGENSSIGETFQLRELSGVMSNEFPNNVQLTIQFCKNIFSQLNFVELLKTQGTLSVKIIFFISYKNWDSSESVEVFCDRLSEKINKDNRMRSKPAKDEVGVFLENSFVIATNIDLYEAIDKEIVYLTKTWRCCRTPTFEYPKVKESYGEGRYHWWMRYVAVPIITSGAIAALLIKLFG